MNTDAVLMIGFGGPKHPEDVRPFLENVSRGRRIPEERLKAVARQYEIIGGKSPMNELTFRQANALTAKLEGTLNVYVGMRNWNPLLVDTISQMAGDGVKNAVGVIMAPQESDSGWDQYQRNVAEAVAQAGVTISVDYPPPVFDHPLFIEAVSNRVRECLLQIPDPNRRQATIVFTAHSIPTSDPLKERYVHQLNVSAKRVTKRLDHPVWFLSYQSRSGRPQDPWLEPDVNDTLRSISSRGERHVILVPIGFLCDHAEVLYDLDYQAAQTARELGITLFRAKTVNDDDLFIQALAERVRGATHGG